MVYYVNDAPHGLFQRLQRRLWARYGRGWSASSSLHWCTDDYESHSLRMRGAPGLERHAFECRCLCKIEVCLRPPRRRLLQERMRFSQRLARRDLTEPSKRISLVLAFWFCHKTDVFADPLHQSMRARPPAVHGGALRIVLVETWSRLENEATAFD